MTRHVPATERARGVVAAVIAVLALSVPASGTRAATLDDVRERGRVRCALVDDLPGFSTADSLGRVEGFDVDLCRAVAAVTLGDADAIEPLLLATADGPAALAADRADVLLDGEPWTLERDAGALELAGIAFHDGQGFVVRRGSGIRTALQLDGARVCVVRGDRSAQAVDDYFVGAELELRPIVFADAGAALAGYARGDCEAYSDAASRLAAWRVSLDDPDAHVLLPESISKAPRGPIVRADDTAWEDVVRWSLSCLIDAEELGVDRATAADPTLARGAGARELLGLEGDAGAALGLPAGGCADALEALGHYGEIHDRHLGPDTPLGLPRGLNALWSDGGLIHAPPLR